MKLTAVTFSNFRCFGPAAQTIPLETELVALLGTNGAGKSSVLAALSKVFGLSSADRSLVRGDFHLPPGKSWDTVDAIEMLIELRFELPELLDAAKIAGAPAAMFKHMAVVEEGKPPVCRARLRAKWSPSSLAEGDIEQDLVWVLAPGKDGVEATKTITSADRGTIVVHYIPATRDPIRHIRQSAGSILHSFLRAISWSAATKEAVQIASQEIRDSIGGEVGMKTVSSLIETCWQELHKEGTHTKVIIQPVAKRIEELIAQVDTVFHPSAGDTEEGLDRLSDGQRSLFYIALVAMSFDVQARLKKDDKHGLEADKVRSPVLTILAVEEPENHVSPHYLGRIVTQLKRIANAATGQVVLTSHSASIMARIEPESVRHLSFDGTTKRSTVRRIALPIGDAEKEKFVRQAVKAYPELYFAKLVVLGEGDSEALVIPRLVRDLGGVELDTNLISFVPLGGRHVNHFWKLLRGLGTPYITLLDLDLGRTGGGWGRIKYALEQLLEQGIDAEQLLAPISPAKLSKMHTWSGSSLDEKMQSWVEHLEAYGVYFSSPLDLDYAMLKAFPAAYQKLDEDAGEKGPRLDSDEDPVLNAVLSEDSDAADYYKTFGVDTLRWYRYLFLGRGKPATHALALGQLTKAELVKDTPDVLKRVVSSITTTLNPKPEDDFDF